MAKSPTPIPAPPVKIQRGQRKPGAPVKRRRKKKVNPVVLFLRGLVRSATTLTAAACFRARWPPAASST